MNKFLIFFIGLSIFFQLSSSSQQDSSRRQTDSLQIRKLDIDLDKINQLSAERLSDSLKRSELERKVNVLGSGEQAEKKALIDELSLLRQTKQATSHSKLHRSILYAGLSREVRWYFRQIHCF